MDYQKYLEFSILGNSGQDYIASLLIFAGALIIFKLVQYIVIKKIEILTRRTETDVDDFLIGMVKGVKPPFYFLLSLYIASRFLVINAVVTRFFDNIIFIVVVLQVVLVLQRVIDYVATKIVQKTTNDEGSDKEKIEEEAVIRMIGRIMKFALWVVAILSALSNMGINVTSAIAGLGIGGIAIAMASKDLLSDMLASLSIYLDKPFRVGQRIQTGTDVGTVEHIGIKTTRLRTPQGEELVISNRDITTARVQNFKKMKKRQVKLLLGVVYGLSAEKLEKIPSLIKEIVESVENVEFSRSHFATYGDFSLGFETVYYVKSREMDAYMEAQQEVNLKIYKKFEEEGIDFAFPTQTVIVEKNQEA